MLQVSKLNNVYSSLFRKAKLCFQGIDIDFVVFYQINLLTAKLIKVIKIWLMFVIFRVLCLQALFLTVRTTQRAKELSLPSKIMNSI